MESIHDSILRQLQACKGTWPTVAAGSGVPLRTLEKIARQEIKNPRIKTVEKIIRYFEAAP